MNNFSGKYKLNLKALDKKAIHIFKVFEIISLSICILASFFLYLYKEFYISKCILECSVLIFRAGLLKKENSWKISNYFLYLSYEEFFFTLG